jgi:CDP-glucose 4,6-dehydratase
MQDMEQTLTDAFGGKRVLITGHTGFKGSWLATWLHLLGADVTGFALRPGGREDHFVQLGLAGRIRHVVGDVRDAEAVSGVFADAQPEFVFHLAAQALVRRSYEQPKLTFDTNVGGSVNVLEAARATGSVRSLIYVTTDKCYRSREWTWGYRENDELGGECPYSASKACAELVLAAYQAAFFRDDSRLRAASVRAGNIVGGGDWAADRIVPDCIRALRDGRTIAVRNPIAVRPWQHVLEPLGGYLLLATRLAEEGGARYAGAWNFGPDKLADPLDGGGGITVARLVEAVTEAWGAGDFAAAEGGEDDAYHETTCLRLNCDKALHRLAWRPAWDFATTVRRTVDWYRSWLTGHDAWDLTSGQVAAYMADYTDRGDSDHDRRPDRHAVEAAP